MFIEDELKNEVRVARLLWQIGVIPNEVTPLDEGNLTDAGVDIDGTYMVSVALYEDKPFGLSRWTHRDGEGSRVMEMLGDYVTAEECVKAYETCKGFDKVTHFSDGAEQKDPILKQRRTVRMELEARLYACGLFEDMCAAVVRLAITEIEAELANKQKGEDPRTAYSIQWDSRNDCPNLLISMWERNTHKAALKWANECMPLAWWKPIFDPEHPIHRKGETSDEQ
jgi:hypothetical protein